MSYALGGGIDIDGAAAVVDAAAATAAVAAEEAAAAGSLYIHNLHSDKLKAAQY